MKIIRGFFAALFCFFLFFEDWAFAAGASPGEAGKDAGEWVRMPAGAKAAYMGIHGGTMPVSLLVAADGSSLLAFAGRTGNDFLDALRMGGWP